MLISLVLASAVIQSPPIDMTPQPSAGLNKTVQAFIVEYRPSTVRCGGQTVTPQFTTEPLPTSIMMQEGQEAPAFTMTFGVKGGRAVAISNPVREARSPVYLAHDDLAPTLAAWRFAADSDHDGCTITFAANSVPLETAPIATIYRFVALPRPSWTGWGQAQKRAMATDGNCFASPMPARLLIGMPDFDRIAQPPATMSWTMVGFDLDSAGKPVRVRTLVSDGNRALDRASVDAVAKSRFAAGTQRTGCNYPYHRRQNAPLAAPAMPPPEARSEVCEAREKAIPMPTGEFPPQFHRRAVEGWAIVQYDIAPWGATGNMKVLRAEPAAAFGDSALSLVRQTKFPASSTGATACIMRVRFNMPVPGAKASEPPAVPVIPVGF